MPDINKKELEEEVKKWKRFYDSLKSQNEKMEKQLQDQHKQINFLTHSLNNAQQSVTLNKDLLARFTVEHSQKEQELVSFMNTLKAKLREMGFKESFESLE